MFLKCVTLDMKQSRAEQGDQWKARIDFDRHQHVSPTDDWLNFDALHHRRSYRLFDDRSSTPLPCDHIRVSKCGGSRTLSCGRNQHCAHMHDQNQLKHRER